MNKFKLWLLIPLIVIAGCGGYKAPSNPRSPEELQIADLAQELQNKAEEFSTNVSPSDPGLTEFAERSARFHNACRRFGANSLEARNAFDRMYFQYAQINKELPAGSDNSEWAKIRSEYVLKIAAMLGYKPQSSE